MKKLLFLALIVGVGSVALMCLNQQGQFVGARNEDDNAVDVFCLEVGAGSLLLGILTGSIGVLCASVSAGRTAGLLFGATAILASAITCIAVVLLSDDYEWPVLLPLEPLWMIPFLLGCITIRRGFRWRASGGSSLDEALDHCPNGLDSAAD
jgi:hypothetical protein